MEVGSGQWAGVRGQESGAGGRRRFSFSVVKEPKLSERLGGNQTEGIEQRIGVSIM